MNYKMVVYVLGRIIQIIGIFLLIPAVVGVIYREKEILAIAIIAVLSIVVGGFLDRKKPKNSQIRAKEGFVITAFTWIVMSIVGAIPFYVTGYIPSITDAVFETASGFTTTGASILTDIEALPHCLLFWRSFTHWIGGMGILVFMLAFVSSSADEMNIMRAESPGPSVEKMVPKVRETAFMLYSIYTVLTLTLVMALVIAGMPVFDSFCVSFGTAGTGGFATKGDSIASYSKACQVIITIGMMLFGVNFNVYSLIVMKKYKELIHAEEVIAYFIIYAVATLIVTLGTYDGFINLMGWQGAESFNSFGQALQQSSFQVASVMTTTGFATTDFDKWANVPKLVMVGVMFIGACAGSTGGGMKVSRWLLYFKQMRRELQSYIHPSSVRSIWLDGKVVDKDTLRTTNVYLMAYMFTFLVSLVLISFDGHDLITSFTAVTATINNIGPGLSIVGPTGNFAGFSNLSKWVFIFDMIAGRLELFPFLIMLSLSTWRKK
ncbi:MAG: TrkH family potassium uptake protein [Eubacterium sp.]|nr:TrkH family potassium uptake protein [Eubacterium sp.]